MSEDSDKLNDFARLMQRCHDEMASQHLDGADATMREMIAFVAEHADDDPSLDSELLQAAAQCEENGDWAGAETLYRKRLARAGEDVLPAVQTHAHLAAICHLSRRETEALDHARRATALARRDDFPMLLVMALQREARYLIKGRNFEDARSRIDECVSLLESDPFNQLRARTLILRAECMIDAGSIADAEQDLAEASGLLEPMAELEMAAGLHYDLACWWATSARLRAARRDSSGAVEAWREAVALSVRVATSPHAGDAHSQAAVADMLQGLAGALSENGNREEARETLDGRTAILDRLGLADELA